MGDGSEIGKCPSSYSNYRCLSTGACNVCGLISGNAEGCDITSTNPVCDADNSLSGTQDSATGKVAQCVACTKSGTHKLNIAIILHRIFLSHCQQLDLLPIFSCFIHLSFRRYINWRREPYWKLSFTLFYLQMPFYWIV